MLTLDLHNYQDPAVDAFLGRGNLLVAFAMGLGKTPIGIACAEELLGCEDIDLCLIVAESSLKYQWAQEIAKFTDIPRRELKIRAQGKVQTIIVPAKSHCLIVDGKPYTHNKVKYSAADDRKRQYESVTGKTDYIITSYDNLVDDARLIRKLLADRTVLAVLDEATAIKTFSAQRTRTIKKILDPPYRLALTGTPVDNRPEELYSIMQWVDPSILGRWDLFDAAYIVRDDFGRPKRYKNLDVLRAKLEPAMARIAHDDERVKDYIPEAVHAEVCIPMDSGMHISFRALAEDLYAALSAVKVAGGFDVAAMYAGSKQLDENSEMGRIMARLLAIDLLLAHPDLLVTSGLEYEDSEKRRQAGEKRAVWPGSKYAYQVWQDGLIAMTATSPKLDYLAKRVPEILGEDEQYKVLVYTRWPAMLDHIAGAIDVPSVKFHGGMDARAKAASVAQFTNDPDTRVFLSSHAGARGVNLYKGSHLINYDVPWAPGMADQINGRHVRASSQFKQVWIENLLVDETTDVWKFHEVLGLKRKVGQGILDGRGIVTVERGMGLKSYLGALLGYL